MRNLLVLTGGDADDLRRRIGRAKKLFHAAVRTELIDRNAFAGQKTQVRGSPDKAPFVTREETARVLAACPDTQWRLMVALARFGGASSGTEERVGDQTPTQQSDLPVDAAGRRSVQEPLNPRPAGRPKSLSLYGLGRE